MNDIKKIKDVLGRHKEDIRKRYGVVILGIFGSYSREEQNEESDIDILVDLERPIGFKFFELWDELERLLNAKVDLLTIKSVKQKPLLWKSIEEDLIYV